MFFQNSVIKKYLASMEAEKVNQAWEIYKAYFLNPAIQENIRASKEEQFQEGFLRELFVKVFGDTGLQPHHRAEERDRRQEGGRRYSP